MQNLLTAKYHFHKTRFSFPGSTWTLLHAIFSDQLPTKEVDKFTSTPVSSPESHQSQRDKGPHMLSGQLLQKGNIDGVCQVADSKMLLRSSAARVLAVLAVERLQAALLAGSFAPA